MAGDQWGWGCWVVYWCIVELDLGLKGGSGGGGYGECQWGVDQGGWGRGTGGV